MKRLVIPALLLVSCAGEDPTEPNLFVDAGVEPDAGMRDTSDLPYAREVVSFVPGSGAGYGRDLLPHNVLGPPAISSSSVGSLDVVSLGSGGEIVLGFAARDIVDGPGPDFVVFENAFFVKGDEMTVFAELGEVAVSTDAVSWRTFACDPTADPYDPGCAGWRPGRPYDLFELPLDPALCGGDPFDLETVGLSWARYVRVRDLSSDGIAPTAGFDLDAIGLVHLSEDR